MNIYKYAMQMEKDGEKYYLELAGKTDNTGLQNILKMLAAEEVKHYQVIEQMSKNDSGAKLAETEVLQNAKSIFMKMRKEKSEFNSSTSQSELYRKAQKTEAQNYKFYLDKSKEVETQAQKKIFLKLAEEEKKHMFLLENLAEFISRPATWIENAEFNHLDDY